MKPLAIPLGCQKTIIKWLVITQQKTLGKSLVMRLLVEYLRQAVIVRHDMCRCRIVGPDGAGESAIPKVKTI
jgi:hypothetical protein